MNLSNFKITNKIQLLLILLLLLFAISCRNNPEPVGRERISFDYNWKFQKGNTSGAEAVDFDDKTWQSLNVPHDWSIEGDFNRNNPAGAAGGYLPGGIGWYRKTFTLQQSYKNKKIIIEFDGVYMNSDVWINGRHLGKSIYGYLSFHYDLTPYLKFGDTLNVIAVKVDNSEQPNSRWYTGSGIFRHVWLTAADKLHIAHWGTYIRTPEVSNKSAKIHIKTTVKNETKETKHVLLRSEILDSSRNRINFIDSESEIPAGTAYDFYQESIVEKPHLWSVENPNLYRLNSKIFIKDSLVDDYETLFGIRSMRFDPDSGFFLNNKNIKIKGVCNHHDLGCLGSALNDRALQRRLEILKDMGCNAIRTSHNFPSPDLLDLCDRMGFLILDEAFDMWYVGHTGYSYDYYFDRYAIRDLKRMIRRDRNHPSVIIWSVGNEISTETMYENGSETLKKLVDAVHEEDKTRPVMSAVVQIKAANETGFAVILDVVGYNYFGGGREFGPSKYDQDHKKYPGRILFGSENASTLSSRGVYHFPADSVIIGTKDMQCSSFDNCYTPWGSSAEENWKAVKDRDFVAGLFVWTGFDYIGEPTPYRWPARSSYFGVLDLCGFPKDGYYFYKSQWTEKPMVHILPHWNWQGKEGELIDVLVYSNCDEVELFLNDKSLGNRNMKSSASLKGHWKVSYVPGAIRVVGKRDGKIVCETERKTAGPASTINLIADRKVLKADGRDLGFIKVRIEDKNGILVPNAQNLIKFKIDGAAKIVGVDNGNPLCHESFKADQHSVFNGLGLLVVQSETTPSKITIRAESEGLKSGELILTTH